MTAGKYHVGYDPRALGELQKLDRSTARRISRAVNALSDDPRPTGVRMLVGYPGLLRPGVGDVRVVYTVDDEELVVLAVRVAHRRYVYRKL